MLEKDVQNVSCWNIIIDVNTFSFNTNINRDTNVKHDNQHQTTAETIVWSTPRVNSTR